MIPPGSEYFSSIDDIKQEIIAQTTILREIVMNIRANEKASDFLAVVLTSVQKLLQLVSSGPFAPLQSVVVVLQQYFQAVEKGLKVNQAQLETLSILIGEITQLADADKQSLDQIFRQRQAALDQAAAELKQYFQHSNLESAAPTPPAQPVSQPTASSTPPPSTPLGYDLLNIFLQELPVQVQACQEQLKTYQEAPQNLALIEPLLVTIHAIKQAGFLVHLNAIVELGRALEDYLLKLKDKKIKWNEQGFELFSQSLTLLKELSVVVDDHVDFFIQEKEALLQDLTQKCLQLSQLDSPRQVPSEKIESVEKPRIEPPQVAPEGIIDPTMFDLFCIELETQSSALNNGLIELEQNPKDKKLLESLMRAAHSIKGAARVVSLNPIVRLAHAMEDSFVAAQNQQMDLKIEQVDQLLRAVDLFTRLAKVNLREVNTWLNEQTPLIETLIKEILASVGQEAKLEPVKILTPLKSPASAVTPTPAPATVPPATPSVSVNPSTKIVPKEMFKRAEPKSVKAFQTTFTQDRVLRVTAQNLNRLMGLAGESLVESRWLYPFGESLQHLKKQHNALSYAFDVLRDHLREEKLNVAAQASLVDLQNQIHELRHQFTERLGELDSFIRRHASLSDRLYQEVINSRMRPFGDGVEGFPRMVRDLARQLGKRVKLDIEGKSTPVDRDILEKLEAPLSHLLRNAIDHGIELPEERQAIGKSVEGTIKLEARHRGGMLAIAVSDDGRGINIEQLRRKIVEKNLVSVEIASRLTDSEVIDFLFLPGFSTAQHVSEISGRGVGLNIVQNMVQEVGGVVHTTCLPDRGVIFHLQLPLTLSVIRALLVEIAGEPYAFPLARIDQAFLINRENIEVAENRQFFHYEGQNIGLLPAWQVLELEEPQLNLKQLPVIIISDRLNCYGLVVDRLIGERELVVQELDARLGKVSDIIAGALMEDGTPVLIIDVEDMVRSIDNLLSGGRLSKVTYTKETQAATVAKRILVVDDSITVREVECRLLQNQGYTVETAVNGVDGWNAVRTGHYDLMITDVDMPRMNGIDLVRAVKNDPKLHELPVMIVSYKESEEDRMKGLEAGADYYLTKSSFHDTTLIDAVRDLIGSP